MAYKRKEQEAMDEVKKAKLRKELEPVVTKPDFKKSRHYEPNIVRILNQFLTGAKSKKCLRWTADSCLTSRLKDFRVFAMDPYKFYRRITAIKWHPRKYNIIALGSKCGEVILQDINMVADVSHKPPQTARHQAITNFCHDPFTDDSLLMSSVDGTISHWNYGSDVMREILDLNSGYETWYMFCSVNASELTGLVVAGDSTGKLSLLSKDLKPIAKHKIHGGKVNSAEFSQKEGHILATASLDKTVKLWDIRMIGKETNKKGMALHLEQIEVEHPINSAYFSKTDNHRLLLTDQRMKLHVYTLPFLTHESTIYHPHRQFQHLTPIKATWHPLADLIVIGRYPDPAWPDYHLEQRSIDIIDAKTGECNLHLVSSQCNIIMSLNEFNITGDYVASGMGMYAAYWKAKQPVASRAKSDADGPRTSRRGDDDSDDDDDDDEPKFKKPSYPGTSKKKQQNKKETKTETTTKTKCTKKTSRK